MPCHPDRVRRNYEEKTTKYYFPCDRYTEHVIVDGKCFMCGKTELEIKLGPIKEVSGY